MAPTTPAQIAIDFYCDVRDSNKQRGRAHTTLPVLLFNEYHSFKQHRKPSKYRQKADVAVRELRKLASNKKGWATLVKDVCAAISIEQAVTVKAEAP